MSKKLTLVNHLTAEQLRRKYLRCQHSQEKMRWHGLYLMALGGVATQVATQLGMSANWISETVHRYNQGGADGVKNKSKNQASKTLSKEEFEQLDREIQSGKTADERLWSATQVKRWVKEKTGKEIHPVTAWRMFGKLNFTRQTPRPQHKERASETEQVEFKKT